MPISAHNPTPKDDQAGMQVMILQAICSKR